MAKRNLKRAVPRSLRHSMELCMEFAKDRKNLNVDRIADLMGLSSKWTLYKWLESARMPVNLVRPFENVCGCSFMTQYIASSAHKLLFDMPSSKPAKEEDLLALQTGFNEAVNVLASFYKGDAEAAEALGELTRHMSEIAAHRARVEKVAEPELELFGTDS
ncbi:MAG: hypothetical protein JKY50_20590 [Oleispira sp.]|nr:hypothetical protein [Oleispira sp.]